MLSIREIRKLIIISVFSVNELLEEAVLKGGNALDLVYDVSPRASKDIDISLPKNSRQIKNVISKKLKNSLERVFGEYNTRVMKYDVNEPPLIRRPGLGGIGGGYGATFSLIDIESGSEIQYDGDTFSEISSRSEKIGTDFLIDFSVSEFFRNTEETIKFKDFEYKIYVYTPEMLVIEKIRALCQSMPDDDFNTPLPPRAKDFVDIYVLIERFNIDLHNANSIELLKSVFNIKEVPINFIQKIGACREFHRPTFETVIDTVYPDFKLKSFDFYFEYLLKRLPSLESFGNE